MEDKIICPKCHKWNGLHQFCVFCGHKLFDDDQIGLVLENPQPYCLNCGRPVEKGQTNCECGYEFADINCPDCNSRNAYANRFCTTCGKKLWTSNVYDYKYPKRLFEKHLIKEMLPYSLRNTSLYQRPKMDFKNFNLLYIIVHFKGLENAKTKMDEYLSEIGSRWKVVSPHYCINCISIIDSNECSCGKCGLSLFADKKRVDCLQTENKYCEHKFDNEGLKWTPKFSNDYFDSLAPAIGESQFEYRERLKWEFAENTYHKIRIIEEIDRKKREDELKEIREKQEEERKRQAAERKMWEEEYMRQYGGGYCSFNCRHCYEEFFDSLGAIVADPVDEGYNDYYCRLGHSLSFGSFCKDYE